MWLLITNVSLPAKEGDAILGNDASLYFKRPEQIRIKWRLKLQKSNEHEYQNVFEKTVRWTFQGIESVGEVFDSKIKHSTEVYWAWFVKVDKPKSLRKSKLAKRRLKSDSQ